MHLYGLKIFKFSIDEKMKFTFHFYLMSYRLIRYNWYRPIFPLYIFYRGVPALPQKDPFWEKLISKDFTVKNYLFSNIHNLNPFWLEIKTSPQILSNQFAVLKFSNKNMTNLSTLWVVISGFSRKLEGFSV